MPTIQADFWHHEAARAYWRVIRQQRDFFDTLPPECSFWSAAFPAVSVLQLILNFPALNTKNEAAGLRFLPDGWSYASPPSSVIGTNGHAHFSKSETIYLFKEKLLLLIHVMPHILLIVCRL